MRQKYFVQFDGTIGVTGDMEVYADSPEAAYTSALELLEKYYNVKTVDVGIDEAKVSSVGWDVTLVNPINEFEF